MPFAEIALLWANRRTLGLLAVHDLRRTTAGTTGRLLWTFVTPLIPMVIFSIIFAFGLRLPLGGAPYAFGFAAGYVPWVLISAAIGRAAGSIVENRFLVKRVVFPVELIPTHAVLVHSVPHVFLLSLVAAACMIGGYGSFTALPVVLYFYACAVIFTVAVSLLLSSLSVVARDVLHLVPALLQVWFWLTPVAWPADALPSPAQQLLALNPASYIVGGYRYALLPAAFSAPTAIESGMFWLMTLLSLLLGSVMFRRLRPYFWECL